MAAHAHAEQRITPVVVGDRAGARTLPAAAVWLLAFGAAMLVANLVFELVRLDDARLDRRLTELFYNGALVAAALSCLIRARRRDKGSLGWLAIGIGLASWAAGDIWYWLVIRPSPGPAPYPSLSDVLFVGFYVGVLVGIGLLARADGLRRMPTPNVAVGLLGIATLWSWLVFSQVTESASGDATAIAITVAYPLLDLAFLLLVFTVYAQNHWRPGAVWLPLALGLGATALADALWAVNVAAGVYQVPALVNSLWPLSALLIGAAAWVPARAAKPWPARPDGKLAAALPSACMLAAIVALVWDHFERLDVATIALAAATLLASAAQLISLYRQRSDAERALREAAMNGVRALAAAVDAKDHYTRDHSQRVAMIAAAIAVGAGLEPERIRRLVLAAHLHDVGKISIPDTILLKPERLSDREYAIVQGHCDAGGRMVEAAGLPDIADWIRHHHERWDGRGYPDGLAGHRIPIESRILGAADALDAMTGKRSYREPLSTTQAAEELMRVAGVQFDPALASWTANAVHSGELTITGAAVAFSPTAPEEVARARSLDDLFAAQPLNIDLTLHGARRVVPRGSARVTA